MPNETHGGVHAVLKRFTPATATWFTGAFAAPTPAQIGAWESIADGDNTLVIAPTGSGKTLAAFLWALDQLIAHAGDGAASAEADSPGTHDGNERTNGEPRQQGTSTDTNPRNESGTRVLYISPLKALGVDVERNLRAPLIGITQTAKNSGAQVPEIRVGVRSGDTPVAERRKLVSNPPDILITTPESLYLMLTSKARSTLKNVRTVIVDEVHALADNKRGAHLGLSLERLDALLDAPAQRIGLSATVEPATETARFLGGSRPVTIVNPGSEKSWELTVSVPVKDMTHPGPPPVTQHSPEAAADEVQADADLGDDTVAQAVDPGVYRNVNNDLAGEQELVRNTTETTIWPHLEARIVELVRKYRSTIVFVNSRRTAERLTGALNDAAGEDAGSRKSGVGSRKDGVGENADTRKSNNGVPNNTVVSDAFNELAVVGDIADNTQFARAHHGSVSKEERAEVEDALKSGTLRCVVATSSLELGIDMGAVDAVIQVESAPSVASSLQRVGRAGHQVGQTSTGWFLPTHRADVVESVVIAERMRAGNIEPLSIPANPLDVLAQQTVAAAALDTLDVETWFDTVRRAASFTTLTHEVYESVLDLLAGRFPSDEFAELRPRIIWDREAGTLTGRPGAQRLAVTSGGTIPDRGLFGVFLAGSEETTGPRRVGELDEEMVYESRVGDVIILGATSWRIQEITADRVLVTPAFGQPGRLPFWRGDAEGRPIELGRAIGQFRAETATNLASGTEGLARTRARLSAAGADEFAQENLLNYFSEQLEATTRMPTDRRMVVERFPDELGDWRVILHSPLGNAVHGPWALAIGSRLQDRYGIDAQAMAADDGIVLRIPATDAQPPGAAIFLFEPEELEHLVRTEITNSALFAARFRENAARALLLPRRDPGRRTPLWQQRQRAAQLLQVASKYPRFPIILETVRECLQDVYDVPALIETMTELTDGSISLTEVETHSGSPFAHHLLFGYTAQFLYEADSPLAERRAAALSLDPALLGQLLGQAELRELFDAEVITAIEADLQRLSPSTRARGVEGVADLLRLLGPLSVPELARRLHPANSNGSESGRSRPSEPGAKQDHHAQNSSSDPVPEPHASPTEAQAWVEELVASNRAFNVRIGGEAVVAAVEDAARVRDGLGIPLPMGIPTPFLEPLPDPLGDIIGRYARTHGPFTAAQLSKDVGLGVAIVQQILHRLVSENRVVAGAFLPNGTGEEYCDVEVLRRIRRRSLAAYRAEVEPVDHPVYARFLLERQGLKRPGTGIETLAEVLDQLAGFSAPASAWENYILPARVKDFSPRMLDELLASGEFLFTGTHPGVASDGWVAFHHAETADLTVNFSDEDPDWSPTHHLILDVLRNSGAWYFKDLVQQVRSRWRASADDGAVAESKVGHQINLGQAVPGQPENIQPEPGRFGIDSTTKPERHDPPGSTPQASVVLEALWDLLFSGRVTNDSFAPLRTAGAHKAKAPQPRARRAMGSRSARLARHRRMQAFPLSTDQPISGENSVTGTTRSTAGTNTAGINPGGAPLGDAPVFSPVKQQRASGRWSAVTPPADDVTLTTHAQAEYLLDRYGVITRGSVTLEDGNFGVFYRLLSKMEEAGQIRRGYFIDGLGAAQFSTAATVDALRTHDNLDQAVQGSSSPAHPGGETTIALAATDPANPYGASLPWPDLPTSHRPGRKAGAVVVLHQGRPVLFLERGGKSILHFDHLDPRSSEYGAALPLAAVALVKALNVGKVAKIHVETCNGEPIIGTAVAQALVEAGFYASPSGVRFRGGPHHA